MEQKEFKIIAKTFQGLEEVLAKELTALGANNIEIGRRMVSFTGDKEMLYRANFCLRTAVRVLMPVCEFKADDADLLYDKVKEVKWEEYMDCNSTFRIDSVVYSDEFHHTKFVSYRVKDAIADYFREKTESRPNVVLTNPDIYINVHISDTDVTISLDSSGESLHKRGWRQGTVAAPINEVLAAGLIMLAGWDGDCDFIDPMCGSGTILIEAALIAQNIAPGVFRKEFAFEKWKDFDEELFDKIYNDDSQEREFEHTIYGYDINRQNIAIAQENAKAAGVSKIVKIEQQDLADFTQPAEKALMITNPPYGERITTDDLLEFYELIGQKLKREFVGNDAWVISHKEECFDKIGLRPSTKYALFNGALECEYRKYQVFEGKLSDRRGEGLDIKSDDDRRRNLKFKPHRRVTDDDSSDEGEGGYDRRRRSFERDKNSFDRERKPFERRRENREDGPRKFRKDRDESDDERPFRGGDSKFRKGDDRRRRDDGHRSFRDKENKPRRFRDDKDKKSGGFGDRKERSFGKGKFGRRDRADRQWGFDSEGRPFRKDEEIDD
jgi:putative N6-adenine-specific DNA methylase